jgi:hypothetical protein
MKGWKTQKAAKRLATTAVHEAAHAVAYVVLFGDLRKTSAHPSIMVDSIETIFPENEYRLITACRSAQGLSNLLQTGAIKTLKDKNGVAVLILDGTTSHRRLDEYNFPQDMERLAVGEFAGPAAEELYTDTEIDLLAPDNPAQSDINNYLYISKHAGLTPEEQGDLLARSYRSAHEFVREHWTTIVNVANALLVTDSLTGEEVKAIVAAQSPEAVVIQDSAVGAAAK